MNRYPAKTENGKVSFRIDLEAAGSALFTVTGQNYDEPVYPAGSGEAVKIESTGPTVVKRESDNVLVVNYLDLKTAKSDKKDIYFMDAMISLFRENGVSMGDPWQHKIQYKKKYLELDTLFKEGSGFEASYHFNIHDSLSTADMKSIRAVTERPDLWSVSMNGNRVPKTEGSYWIDKDFGVFAVGPFLKPGKNTLTLKAPRMHILAELMPVYFLGDFLVKPAGPGFEITGGEIGSLGSWREAGLPFYAQKVAYAQSFVVNKTERSIFKVKLKQWYGTVAGVLVNGQPAGLIAWQPYDLDITSLLNNGRNSVAVTVTGSLKNTFGVFYNKNDDWIIGPHSWMNAPAKEPSASGYFLLDYGLFEPFELLMIK
jgi:hypothetical protein